MLRALVIFSALALWNSWAHASGTGGRPLLTTSAFTVQTEADGWTLKYTRTRLPAGSLAIGGESHLLFTGAPPVVSADSGSPQLPMETVSLGIPFGSTVTLELVDPVYQESTNELVAPVPRYRKSAEGGHTAVYLKDPSAYAADRIFPSRTLWSDPPFVFRQQQIVTLHFAPVLYNPAKRLLKRLVSGGIRVRLVAHGEGKPSLPMHAAQATDGRSEPVYRSLLANYDQAKLWRRASSGTPASTKADPTRDWFVPGGTYFRIPVVRDGWYRLTNSDLAGAGGSIDTGSVAVWYRGARIPLVARGDSSMEFYALRNHGDSTYDDWFTDTSSYWLTPGGTPSPRYTPAGPPGSPVTAVLRSALTTVHLEQNTALYQGTDESELTNSGPIPGKGWAWEFYYPSNKFTHTFTLDSIDQSVPTATLRVRLYSTTPHYQTPDHIARFWVNDSLVGSLSFNGRTEGKFTATIPARLLVKGTNRITILSDPPASPYVNQFYLDWFEIDYQRFLNTNTDQIVFTSPSSSGGGNASITVTGFRTPTIEVYDLKNGRLITGGVVSGSPLTGYSVAFQDSFAVARQYAVITPGEGFPVLPVSRKSFSDIRTNAAGADYIIITHREFMTAARQLASFRRSANNVRVAVIDVQDIYDQFNYGMLNTDPVRNFLRYAVASWAPPAPTYLLMFGDASWDFHAYLPTTVKTNFVPAYGVPGGDNWFACLDSTNPVIPSLLVGRLPVQDSAQALSVVNKIITYESSVPDEWTKSFLFIAGGTTAGEQADFNSRNDFTANTYVVPPPVGGRTYRVYKTTSDAVDGEHKLELQGIINNGIVFLNFLGHSGGRVWGVDAGSPNDLQNTNGRLPFVSSVSCNVGAFSEPSSNVLSEDFVLADNRGAVAVWASASLAYASVGSALVNNFFTELTVDSVRDFGTLSTAARLQLWQSLPANYISVGAMNLTPLLGDPLSHLALATKPDLAVSSSDLYLDTKLPTPADSVVTLTALVHNYGLVPSDSVTIVLADTYNGQTTPLLNNARIEPVRFRDSLAIPWRGTKQVGLHTFQLTVDPAGRIDEVTKTNNTASAVDEVYANLLYVVRPLPDMLVSPGAQILKVTSPIGVDSSSMQITFQMDTAASFSSAALVTSPPVIPGPVSAEWTTPPLSDGTLYFWRARSFSSTITNAWVTSSFRCSTTTPSSPVVRWSETTSQQFNQGTTNGTSVTDSGVTISGQPPSRLLVRSCGYRADANKDFYSIVQLDQQTMFGLWWELGTGFMGMRVNPLTRTPIFRAFDVPGTAGQADSMQSYIDGTPAGHYIALTVIYDGRTNVTAGLRSSIKSLGAVFIDSLQPGDAWEIIAVKGGASAPLEHWSRSGVTLDSLMMQNVYSAGSGTFAGITLPVPQRWETFRWSTSGTSGSSDARVAIVGIRTTGSADTLRVIPKDSAVADLSALNAAAADPAYVSFRAVALLSSSDARSTPVLRSWSADFEPSADLAISSHTLSAPKIRIPAGVAGSVTLRVYNIGYRIADSARVILSYLLPDNSARPLAYAIVDSIPAGGSRPVQMNFPTAGLPAQFTIQARVVPSSPEKELIWENNVTLYNFTVQPGVPLTAKMRVYSDGVQLMDGDYVATRPKVLIRLYDLGGVGSVPPSVDLYVDNVPVGNPVAGFTGAQSAQAARPLDDPTFAPVLTTGTHEMKVRVSQVNAAGTLDTVVQQIAVNVTDQYKILQMFNYPDPFRSDTWFTLVITGDAPPEDLTVRIYTVAGRKIREIKPSPGSLQVGFNRVYWDGRDAQGDDVANGYYLYQVQISAGGKSLTATGKLARVR